MVNSRDLSSVWKIFKWLSRIKSICSSQSMTITELGVKMTNKTISKSDTSCDVPLCWLSSSCEDDMHLLYGREIYKLCVRERGLRAVVCVGTWMLVSDFTC